MIMTKKNKGFTLIEIMIVVALIAIISLFAFPSYQNAQRKARISEGVAALTAAQSQIEKYRLTARKQYKDITQNDAGIGTYVNYSGKKIYDLSYAPIGGDVEDAQLRATRYSLIATSTDDWGNNPKCKFLHLAGHTGTITGHKNRPTTTTDFAACFTDSTTKSCVPVSECK